MPFGAHIISEKFIIALSALITIKKTPRKFGVSQISWVSKSSSVDDFVVT